MAFDRVKWASEPNGVSILLVGEDPESRAEFVGLFEGQGYDIRQMNPTEAEADVTGGDVDLVIYDERRAPGRAIGYCRTSAVEGGAPIILLSEEQDPVSQIVALEVGADEVLTAPIDGRLLLARVRAMVRRARSTPRRAPTDERWTLDVAAQVAVAPNGDTVELARHQVRLMKLFLDNPGTVITPELIARLDPGLQMEPAAFRTAISRLRRRLEAAGGPDFIRIVRGSGYMHRSPSD